jgi:hypothetical protein
MNVFLTFDVEVWCGGWRNLDNAFPKSFERYVYGHSRYGDYALPKTVSILNQHGLKGVFFVEPLFATRFGTEHLETIVRLITEGGHEVQLHLHPEWVNEATQPIIKDSARKRQHLNQYTLDEQTTLIGYGKKMLEAAGSGPISAFRAGSYAANRDTFNALHRNGINLDWSLNRCFPVSAPELRAKHDFNEPFVLRGVTTYPAAVMTDGFGNERPAQVTACGFGEMRDALVGANRLGWRDFCIISHNFEMLKAGGTEPDWIVVKRFNRLCAFLAHHKNEFCVRGMGDDLRIIHQRKSTERLLPQAKWLSTSQRHIEQMARRWL